MPATFIQLLSLFDRRWYVVQDHLIFQHSTSHARIRVLQTETSVIIRAKPPPAFFVTFGASGKARLILLVERN
jgi:hypothetical protein